VLYTDVAKLDRDVALVDRVCSKCSYVFSLMLQKCFHIASCKCFMWILHMLQWLYTMLQVYCSYYFRCFRRMLHMFYLGITYVSRICLEVFHLDIVYASHICCKCFVWMLHMFCNGYTRVSLVFHTYVASVSIDSDVCCKCFIYMLQK
jgi:hypothetical protein